MEKSIELPVSTNLRPRLAAALRSLGTIIGASFL
jgi:hypothetical protein